MSSEPLLPATRSGEESSALSLTLRALRPLLANDAVTELCINRPLEAFLETHETGIANLCRSQISIGVLDWPNWSPIRPNSESTPHRPFCRRHCRPGNACRSSCLRPPQLGASLLRSGARLSRYGTLTSWIAKEFLKKPASRDRSSTLPRTSCCGC